MGITKKPYEIVFNCSIECMSIDEANGMAAELEKRVNKYFNDRQFTIGISKDSELIDFKVLYPSS